jgi:hypothetical protein
MWEGAIAKTVLGESYVMWRYHMIFSILFPVAACTLALAERSRSFGARIHEYRKHTDWYRICCIGLALGLWGIVSSLFQETAALNLLYSVGFLGMFAYCWLITPITWDSRSISQFLDIAIIPIALSILASFIWPKYTPYTGRFVGVFYTTAQAAWSAGLCAIVCFYRLHSVKGLLRLFYLACFIGAIAITAMTRTRGHIAALIVAVMAMSLAGGSVNTIRKSMVRTSVFASLAAILIVALLSLSPSRKTHLVHYFRLTDNMPELLKNRSENWTDGMSAIAANSFLGQGWLSRWGGVSSSEGTEYTYDDDPHNFVLTTGKSLGIIGCVLAVSLLIILARLLLRPVFLGTRYISNQFILFAGLASWLIIISLVGNILISFGATTDRYCWGIMSLLILANKSPRNIHKLRTHPIRTNLALMSSPLPVANGNLKESV